MADRPMTSPDRGSGGDASRDRSPPVADRGPDLRDHVGDRAVPPTDESDSYGTDVRPDDVAGPAYGSREDDLPVADTRPPEDPAGRQVELQEPVGAPEDAGREDREHAVVTQAQADLRAREAAGERLGGEPVGRAELWGQQGNNTLGYENDCALAATSEVLRDCDVPRSEDDVVREAAAKRLCQTWNADPAENGGVRDAEPIRQLLVDNGVDARVVHPDTPEELARWVDQGHGVITEVNAGELWDGRWDAPHAYAYDALGRAEVNHAVHVTGTTTDESGRLTGFVINDTGVPDGAGTVVRRDVWERCWTDTDRQHETVVTTLPTRAERIGR